MFGSEAGVFVGKHNFVRQDVRHSAAQRWHIWMNAGGCPAGRKERSAVRNFNQAASNAERDGCCGRVVRVLLRDELSLACDGIASRGKDGREAVLLSWMGPFWAGNL